MWPRVAKEERGWGGGEEEVKLLPTFSLLLGNLRKFNKPIRGAQLL